MGLVAKFYAWKVWINGQTKYISVASTSPVDLTNQTGANFNNRGYWIAFPAAPYMTFDVVQYGTGVSQGTYQSLIDNNLNAPDSGIGWTQIGSAGAIWQ